MTTRIKKSVIALGIFVIPAVGWNAFVWYKQSLLSAMAKPFFAACQGDAGCIIAPEGWKPNDDGGYFKELYDYAATKDSFTLRQHLAIDVWLVAEGGKGKPVHTHRVVN